MGTSANAERREATRRRFNGTVELALPDEPESYEADAVDLSIGGMSLKTAFLPDIGSELDCRFVLDGSEPRTVQARAQVVWARDNGADAGAFGLRFMELANQDRAALTRLCEPGAKSSAADDRVRLRLPKMAEPLKARVHQEVDGAIVVGMDLSFITLGEHVEVERSAGSRAKGTLEDVSVDVDPKTNSARLVLTVSLDGAAAKPAVEKAPVARAVPVEKPKAIEKPAAVEKPKAVEAAPAPVRAASVEPARTANESIEDDDTMQAPYAQSARPAAVPSNAHGTEVLSSADGAARADAASTSEDGESSSLASRSSAPAWLVSAIAKVRSTSQSAWEKASPSIKKAFAALVTFAMTFSAKVRAKITGKPLELPAPAKTERSTAKAPAANARPALRKQRPDAVEAPAIESSATNSTEPAMRRKYAMIGLGAFGLSAIVFALATGGRERRPQTPRPQVAVEATPAAATPAATTPSSDPASAAAATTGAASEAEGSTEQPAEPARAVNTNAAPTAPRMPTDLVAAARSRNANVESELPTVRREVPAITMATRGARAAAAAPARVEAAGPVRPLGSPTVRTGTVLRLRFDGPIANLTGGASGRDALSFRVEGRRVVDRAAGFVRMDPRIAGAGAFNRGGASEFTLRFHGTAPQFAARARGDVLEVTLAGPTTAAVAPPARPTASGARVASMPRPRR